MLLAIDTSTRYAGVALLDREGRLSQLLHWRSTQNHTVELMPAIEATLSRASISLQDVTGIAVALGPGSFSALRVGLSIAKGLAWSASLPMVAATTLETEAYPYAAAGHFVCAILDAGRGQLSWATFEPIAEHLHQTTPEAISDPEELIATLPPDTLICGEGVEKFGGAFSAHASKGIKLAMPYLPGQRVISLGYIGWQRLRTGYLQDPAILQPLYLRRPSISQPKRPIVRPTNPSDVGATHDGGPTNQPSA